MMESVRGAGTFERDIEQALVALKKGAHLLKYGRKGKPRFCPFRLSSDGRSLIWYYGKEEFQLSLSLVTRIVPGQRTANFQRHLQPDKEYQSFSLIYGQEDQSQSLDLICRDKEQAELWFVGLKALIGGAGQSHQLRGEKRNDSLLSLDITSPVGRLQPSGSSVSADLIPQQEFSDTYRPHSICGSSPKSSFDKQSTTTTTFSVDSSRKYPPKCSVDCVDLEAGSGNLKDNASEGFRVSLSSMISSSSQGSAQEDGDALGDVYMWGEGTGDGMLGGGVRVGAMVGSDALLPKHLESAVMLDVQDIACGSKHAALVNRQGEVFCWGEESGGRLGHGINADVPQPRLLETLACVPAEFVACGDHHTCVVTLTGDFYTWGNGSQSLGLLGHGNDVSHWVPRRVALPEGIRVASVACGPWHTALVTSSGQLFTFGDGTFGVLGHGDKVSSWTPREVESLKGLRTIKVACGVWHTAAVVAVMIGYSGGSTCASGKLFTWGDGDKGRLGHVGKDLKLVPTCVSALVDHDFRQVACGHSLTVALTTSGQVFTMGSSICGQLGDPLAKGQTPGMVEGKLWEAFVEEIACGSHHVAVLTSKSDVYTWGKGGNGQLGHGDVQDRHTPTRVEALKDKQVKSIACGSSFTAAICLHKLFTGADQTMCSGCRMPFVFTRKRHNCYNCGHAFCHTCSNKKVVRAKLAPNPKKPYRVCDSCYLKITTVAEAGPLSQLVQHPTVTKRAKIKSDTRGDRTPVLTPRLPPLEPSKSQDDNKTTAKQMRKHESLRRVSPAPFDLDPRAETASLLGFDPNSALIKSSLQPLSTIASSFRSSEKLSSPAFFIRPSHSTMIGFRSSGFSSHDVTIHELKETNRALHEELLKAHTQIDVLKQRCRSQEDELHRSIKEMETDKLLAGEEAAKCRAAKEVIKSLTLQLKELASKMPNRAYLQNGNETPAVQEFAIPATPKLLTASGYDGTLGNGVQTVSPWKSSNQVISHGQDLATNVSTHPDASAHRMSREAAHTPRPYTNGARLHVEHPGDHAKLAMVASTPNEIRVEKEWVQQDDPGVYITFISLPDGNKDLKRVRFSRKKFSEAQAEQWWAENRARVYEQYKITVADSLSK